MADLAVYENSLSSHLRANKARVIAALDEQVDWNRYYTVVMNMVRRTPALADCAIESVFESVVKCAELGLEPGGPLGHAYLIPFKKEAVLVIGYKGWLHLMFKGGGVQDAEAHVVFEEDLKNGFKLTRTAAGTIIHHPFTFTPEEKRGKPLGAYAVVRFANGGRHVEPMSWDEVMKAKAVSPSAGSSYSPWNTWLYEMAKKTALKRAAKWAPTGRDYTLMARAWQHDVEGDVVESQPGKVLELKTQAPQLASEGGTRTIDNTIPVSLAAAAPAESAAKSDPPPTTPPAKADAPAAATEPTPAQRESNEFAAMMKELYACTTAEQVDAFTERHTGWAGSNRAELVARIKERRGEIAKASKTRKET